MAEDRRSEKGRAPSHRDNASQHFARSSDVNVWIAILAAGASRRMGEQKLAMRVPDGRPMIRVVLDAALAVEGCQVMVVMDGANVANGARVREAIEGTDVTMVDNPTAHEGQSTSIRAAVVTARERKAGAILFLLGDEPEMHPHAIEAVVRNYKVRPSLLVQAHYDDGFGHPVLFSSDLFGELLDCIGDEGGRSVVRRHQAQRNAVDVPGMRPVDIDTKEAYDALCARWQSANRP